MDSTNIHGIFPQATFRLVLQEKRFEDRRESAMRILTLVNWRQSAGTKKVPGCHERIFLSA